MPACEYHEDRAGIGICMRCEAVICKDCCTRVDGVNHCHACLKKLAAPLPPRKRDRREPLVMPLLGLMLSWLILGSAFLFLRIQGILAP